QTTRDKRNTGEFSCVPLVPVVSLACPARLSARSLFRRLLLFIEQSHYAVDRVLLLLLLLTVRIRSLPIQKSPQQSSSDSFHIRCELRIRRSSRNSKRNSHSTDLRIHLERQLVGRTDRASSGKDSNRRHREIDVVCRRPLRRHLHIRTEI